MGRKGENIFKRKDGRYEARYIIDYINGKAKYYSVYGKTYSEAKNKRRISMKEKVIKKNKSNKNTNFEELINLWLEYKKKKIKMSSFTTYYATVNKHIKPIFGNCSINTLNENIFNDYIFKLIDEKKLSRNTIHEIANLIKQILIFNKITNINIYIPAKEQKEITIFTKEEINIIKMNCLTYEDRIKFSIILSLYTGIRLGELCSLKKENFDLRNKIMKINNTLIRVKCLDGNKKTKVILSPPKSKKSLRLIPIPESLNDYIIFYLSDMNNDSYFLSNSNKYIEPRVFYNKYHKLLKIWNINYKKFHTTRHTFATIADEKNVSTKVLSEILGHANTNITQSLYIHPTLKHKRKIINQIF